VYIWLFAAYYDERLPLKKLIRVTAVANNPGPLKPYINQ